MVSCKVRTAFRGLCLDSLNSRTFVLMHFFKYQGAGNDFVVVDNRNNAFPAKDQAYIEKLCDRRFGIGADGLMLLRNSEDFDFEMHYFNADGRLGSLCGNGGRCIVAFANDLGLIGEVTRFLAVDGPHDATIDPERNWISLRMTDVHHFQVSGKDYVLDTGSPHYVRMVKNLQAFDVFKAGREIRNSDAFLKPGINVNFVEEHGNGFAVRTYERGVEDETLACGTGVTAVALAMAVEKGLEGNIDFPIKAQGGELRVRFNRSGDNFREIFLEGPAKRVFAGEI